jgi:O-antigen/teichoic acid export membrane protein
VRRYASAYRSFGLPLFLGRVPNLLAYRADVLLLTLFWPLDVVGHYALATAAVNVVVVFGQSAATARFRSFSGALLLRRQMVRDLLTAAALAVAAVAAGALVIEHLLGDAYDDAVLLLPVVALAALASAAYQPYNSWLLANGAGGALRRLLLVVAGLNAAANLALIPQYGAAGAAFASVLGNVCYLFLARRAYAGSRRRTGDEPTS